MCQSLPLAPPSAATEGEGTNWTDSKICPRRRSHCVFCKWVIWGVGGGRWVYGTPKVGQKGANLPEERVNTSLWDLCERVFSLEVKARAPPAVAMGIPAWASKGIWERDKGGRGLWRGWEGRRERGRVEGSQGAREGRKKVLRLPQLSLSLIAGGGDRRGNPL